MPARRLKARALDQRSVRKKLAEPGRLSSVYDVGIIWGPILRESPMRSAALCTLVCAGTLAVLGSEPATASAILTVRPMFPRDNVWNVPIDTLPVDPSSNAYVATIGATQPAHPDFGTVYAGAPNGIPFVVVSGAQARVAVSFDYADESDPG